MEVVLNGMRDKFSIIAAIAILVTVAPFLILRQTPEAKASQRILEAFRSAEAPVFAEGGLSEVEKFATRLKAINLDDAPQDVREAMVAMIRTVEANAIVRRAGGDTNTANDKVAFAKRDLIRALEKWRGQPY